MLFYVSLSVVLLAAFAGLGALYVVSGRKRKRKDLLNRVDYLLGRGEFAEAESTALRAQDSIAEPHLLHELRRRRVWALVGKEDYSSATTAATENARLAKKPVERAQAIVDHAMCLAAVGEFDQAVAKLADIAPDALPADVAAERALVEADLALCRLKFAEAETALATLIAGSLRGRLYDKALLGHARLQYLKGNFRQAIAEINRLLDTIKGEDLQAEALLWLALALVKQERPAPAEADQALSKAVVLAHYPGLAAVVVACHALLQAHFGNDRDMLDAARRAPKMTHSKRYAADVECLIGDAYLQRNQFGEARAAYQRALGMESGSLQALWGLGACAQMTGLFEIAETYFKLCIEAAPEHFLGQRSESAIEA